MLFQQILVYKNHTNSINYAVWKDEFNTKNPSAKSRSEANRM
jgi:hypothetical protein